MSVLRNWLTGAKRPVDAAEKALDERRSLKL